MICSAERAAIPPLPERLGAEGGLKGALISIDAIANNPVIAQTIAAQGGDRLPAVKANQPTLRVEFEAAFDETEPAQTHVAPDKGQGRIETRHTAVLNDVARLAGPRRCPGETRLPGAACLIRAIIEVETAGRKRSETRYFILSRTMTAEAAAEAAAESVRSHWAIENRLRLRSST